MPQKNIGVDKMSKNKKIKSKKGKNIKKQKQKKHRKKKCLSCDCWRCFVKKNFNFNTIISIVFNALRWFDF